MSDRVAEEARRIGFNQALTVGDAVLHVQTEVTGREQLVVRTTVLRGGVVIEAESNPCPPELQDLGEIRALAEGQHQQHIERLLR